MNCIICEIDDLPTIKIGYYHYDIDDEFVADYVIDLHKEDDGNIFYAVHSSVKYDLNGGEYIVKDSTGKAEDGIIWIDAG